MIYNLKRNSLKLNADKKYKSRKLVLLFSRKYLKNIYGMTNNILLNSLYKLSSSWSKTNSPKIHDHY